MVSYTTLVGDSALLSHFSGTVTLATLLVLTGGSGCMGKNDSALIPLSKMQRMSFHFRALHYGYETDETLVVHVHQIYPRKRSSR